MFLYFETFNTITIAIITQTKEVRRQINKKNVQMKLIINSAKRRNRWIGKKNCSFQEGVVGLLLLRYASWDHVVLSQSLTLESYQRFSSYPSPVTHYTVYTFVFIDIFFRCRNCGFSLLAIYFKWFEFMSNENVS